MRSTGEVLGMADSFGLAYFKAQEAAKPQLPLEGTVLISVSRNERDGLVKVAKEFARLGMKILATEGTHAYLAKNGVGSELIKKLYEGRPNILDSITNREIQLVINTPAGKLSQHDDSYIRKTAVKYKIPYITTLSAAKAAVLGIAERRGVPGDVKSLQEYHTDIR
jgi:carbamoyl-phosphate synthase large subunit